MFIFLYINYYGTNFGLDTRDEADEVNVRRNSHLDLGKSATYLAIIGIATGIGMKAADAITADNQTQNDVVTYSTHELAQASPEVKINSTQYGNVAKNIEDIVNIVYSLDSNSRTLSGTWPVTVKEAEVPKIYKPNANGKGGRFFKVRLTDADCFRYRERCLAPYFRGSSIPIGDNPQKLTELTLIPVNQNGQQLNNGYYVFVAGENRVELHVFGTAYKRVDFSQKAPAVRLYVRRVDFNHLPPSKNPLNPFDIKEEHYASGYAELDTKLTEIKSTLASELAKKQATHQRKNRQLLNDL